MCEKRKSSGRVKKNRQGKRKEKEKWKIGHIKRVEDKGNRER